TPVALHCVTFDSFFFEWSVAIRHLHSFPTRRSSDLLLTSLLVALGGLYAGWRVYRNVQSPAQDRLQIPVLKNKYYLDEIYDRVRSEEHTSELQSRENLVCRLLLEKKKYKQRQRQSDS